MPGKGIANPGAREPGAVLLLPGMTMNGSIFGSLWDQSLSVQFNDLVLEPRGESPELLSRRMAYYVDLLENRLGRWDGWAARPRIVVGHSFGGMLALTWLAARGATLRTVDGLVLIATSAGPIYDAVSLRLLGLAGWELRLPVGPLIHTWNRPAVTRFVKRLASRGGLTAEPVDFQALRHRGDLAVDYAGWRHTDWRAMRSYRLAMEGFDLRHALPRIPLPTVVLHGTRDSLFPVQSAEVLASGLPNAELRVVEGAGHALPLTHPEAVRLAVQQVSLFPAK